MCKFKSFHRNGKEKKTIISLYTLKFKIITEKKNKISTASYINRSKKSANHWRNKKKSVYLQHITT